MSHSLLLWRLEHYKITWVQPQQSCSEQDQLCDQARRPGCWRLLSLLGLENLQGWKHHWASVPLLDWPCRGKGFCLHSVWPAPQIISMYIHYLSHFLAVLPWLLMVGEGLPLDPAPQKASHSRLSKHSSLGLLARSAPALGHHDGLLQSCSFSPTLFLHEGTRGGKKWMQHSNAFN